MDMLAASAPWAPVLNYEGVYEVNDHGGVRSLDRRDRRGRRRRSVTLAQYVNRGGYLQVTLFLDGKAETREVHYLVCEAFHGPRPDGTQARHLDGVQHHNAPGNLAWGTPVENAEDMSQHGTHASLAIEKCPEGHEYSAENTYHYDGHRHCKECRRRRSREAARARRARRAQVPVEFTR